MLPQIKIQVFLAVTLPCCILSSVICDESFLKGALFLHPIVQLWAIVLGYY